MYTYHNVYFIIIIFVVGLFLTFLLFSIPGSLLWKTPWGKEFLPFENMFEKRQQAV